MISTYFIEFKNTGCEIGEDFMSYATAQVSVPVVNNYDIFNNSLICSLFTSTISANAIFIVNKKPIHIIQNLINIIFYFPKKYY